MSRASKPRGQSPEVTDLRHMGLVALRKLGGVEYLVRVGDEHPPAFMAFLAKTMPREIQHDLGPNLLQQMEAALERRKELAAIPGEVVPALVQHDHSH